MMWILILTIMDVVGVVIGSLGKATVGGATRRDLIVQRLAVFVSVTTLRPLASQPPVLSLLPSFATMR